MKNKAFIAAVIAGAVLLVLLLLILPRETVKKTPSVPDTFEKIKNKGVVRVGYANEAPFAYMDTSTRKLTGEAPEIARVILKKMGINKVEGVLTEFGSLIPGLKARRFDMIAAGMYITPERCKEVSFSNPTYTIGQAFIVKKGNPLNLHSYEDIAKNEKAKVGVVVGAVERGYARALGVPDERIVVFPDTPSALAGVLANRVGAFAGTSLTVARLLKESKSRELEQAHPFQDPIIEGKVAGGYGAFTFRKDDKKFLEEFNRHLKDFIGTQEHLDLVSPFGFTRESLPGAVTAKELCIP